MPTPSPDPVRPCILHAIALRTLKMEPYPATQVLNHSVIETYPTILVRKDCSGEGRDCCSIAACVTDITRSQLLVYMTSDRVPGANMLLRFAFLLRYWPTSSVVHISFLPSAGPHLTDPYIKSPAWLNLFS